MGNPAIQILTESGTWTAPAGVRSVTVTPNYRVAANKYFNSDSLGYGCFLNKAGAYFAFGQNNQGQLGTSDLVDRSNSTIIPAVQIKRFFPTSAVALLRQSWGIDNLNRLVSWGQNGQGQIGSNDVTTGKSSPTIVLGSFTAQRIATVTDTTQIITTLNQMYVAGNNQDGEAGINISPAVLLQVSSPTLVAGGLSFKSVSGNNNSVDAAFYGITTSDVGYSWGANGRGQLGTNENPSTIVAKSSPTIIAGGISWKEISGTGGGASAALGISTAGKLYTWGQANGLGDGSTLDRSSPAMIAAALTFSKLAEGGTQMAIESSGDIYAWSFGAAGIASASTPTLISNGTAKFVSVKFISNIPVAFGLTTDGKLYSWGGNADGQLGLGDNATRSTPTLISSLTNVIGYKVAERNCYAVLKNGDVYSWGANLNGQLGTGDTVARSTPTLIGTIKLPGVETSDIVGFPSSTNVPVTPGTAYTVTFATGFSTLGSTNVAFGELESLAISYSQ